MKKNKLLSSGLIYTIGNLLVQSLSFITLPLYTRIMNVDDYGAYNLYVSWVSIFVIFLGIQMHGSFSIAKIKFQDKFDDYVSTATILSMVVFSIFLIVFSISKSIVANILGFSTIITAFMLFQSYFNHLQNSFSQYFVQQQESMKQLILSMSIALMNLFLSVGLLYFLEDNFFARVLASIIVTGTCAFIFVIFILKKSSYRFNPQYIRFILVTSLPLVFHILGHNLLNQLDRIMIGKYMNTESVAIYSFGYSIGLIIQIVLMSMNTAWIPWFFAEKKKGNFDLINKYKERYIVIATFLTIGYLTIVFDLIDFMGTGIYLQSKQFVIWIVLSYFIVFLYTFPVNIQFFYENTRYIPIGTLLATIINYLCNLYFIPHYGIYGAAVATFVSYLMLLVFHHIIARKRYQYDDITFKSCVMLVIIVSIYGLFIMCFMNHLLIRWGVCALIFLGLLWYYREDIYKYK